MYALLLLLSMAAVAFVLSTLTVREIFLTRTTDDGAKTLYAAESGVERALDIIGDGRAIGATLASTKETLLTLQGSLQGSDVRYTIDEETKNPVTLLRIPAHLQTPEGRGIQIEMFDPDQPFVVRTEQADRVKLLWNIAPESACPVSRLELTYQEISEDTLADGTIAKQIVSCMPGTTTFDCSATLNTPSPPIQFDSSFLFRARALECPVGTMEVSFVDGRGTEQPVSMPGVLQVVATGDGIFTQHIVTATMKWLPSASQLGDFVLFSVDKVEKGVGQ